MHNDTVYDLDNTAVLMAEEPAINGGEEVDSGRVVNDDGSVTLTLKYTVKLGLKSPASGQVREEVIDTITVKRVKGATLRALMRNNKDEEKCLMLLWKNLTGLHDDVFDRLDAADVERFTAEVKDFLPGSE